MAEQVIRAFEPDPERLAPLRECMENYDVGETDAEWPNNILSRRAVVYGNGAIARAGEAVSLAVDADELALCQRLAAEAAAIMDGADVGMGSEACDPFYPFFIAANVDEPVPTRIDESLIRARFGGTIFPPATITVEPLAEEGVWWSEVEQDGEGHPGYLLPWRGMIEWFRTNAAFVDSAFVRIGDADELADLDLTACPEGTEICGSVLPRLAVGLTKNGSLAGLFGYSVQT